MYEPAITGGELVHLLCGLYGVPKLPQKLRIEEQQQLVDYKLGLGPLGSRTDYYRFRPFAKF